MQASLFLIQPEPNIEILKRKKTSPFTYLLDKLNNLGRILFSFTLCFNEKICLADDEQDGPTSQKDLMVSSLRSAEWPQYPTTQTRRGCSGGLRTKFAFTKPLYHLYIKLR